MRLLKVRYKNFRCLSDTGWIALSDLSVFIGENDSGKTAALNGLALLLGGGSPLTNDISLKGEHLVEPATGADADAPTVETRAVPVPGGNPDVNDAPMADAAADAERLCEDELEIYGVFRLEPGEELDAPLNCDGNLEIGLVFDGRTVEWIIHGQVPADEDLRVDPDRIALPALRELLRSKGAAVPAGTTKPPVVEAARQLIQRSPKVSDTLPNARPVHVPFFSVVDFRSARGAQSVMNETLRDLFRQLVKSNASVQLSKVEQKITKQLQQKADEFGDFVHRYRQDVREVIVRPEVDFANGLRDVDIILTDRLGRPIPMEKRGEGLRQHLQQAAFEWSRALLSTTSSVRRIFLFDEPETHLDYHAQRRMLGIMEDYARRGQVFASTHSMNLINRVPLDQLVHLAIDKSTLMARPQTMSVATGLEAAEINRIGDSLGIENATLFYERSFMFFEGATEERALPRMYEVWSDSKWYLDGVRFINGHNNDGAIQFARFLHENDRPVLALVDEDTTFRKSEFSRQFTKAKFEGQVRLPVARIRLMTPSCFELSFSDNVWYRAISAATAGSNKISVRKLRSLRASPASFLDYLSKKSGGLSKPQLGAALASVVTKKDLPRDLTEAFQLAKSLALQ